MNRISWRPSPPYLAAPHQVETFVKGVDGTRLYVRRRDANTALSNAPTILLCDGVACDGFVWRYLWNDFAAYGPVAHWHYRGHGRSESPKDPDCVKVHHFAADCDEVRKALSDPDVILVGHSFGVQVALETYRLRPEKIRGLILCCGAAGKVTETFYNSDFLAQMLPRVERWVSRAPDIAQAFWSRVPAELSVKVGYMLGEVDKAMFQPEDLMSYLNHVSHLNLSLFLRILRSAGEHTALDFLPKVHVPALVFAGERDKFTPPRLAEEMADLMPNATHVLLANGTHAAIIELPHVVRAHIDSFMTTKIIGPQLSEKAPPQSEELCAPKPLQEIPLEK